MRQVVGVGAEYRLSVAKNGALDELTVEYDPTWLAARTESPDSAQADLRNRIQAALKSTIGLRCTMRPVPPGSHESQLFKARRVIDRRKETEQCGEAVAEADKDGAEFDAVVIGAGFSGLYMLRRLRTC